MATKKKAAEPEEKKPEWAKTKWSFPRATLEQALEIPMALKEHNGGNPWETDQVRKAVGIVHGGNGWLYLTAVSRDYGLTSGTRDTPEIHGWRAGAFGAGNIGGLFLSKGSVLAKPSWRVAMIQSANSILFNRSKAALAFRRQLFT
jgi:hypothetical protein